MGRVKTPFASIIHLRAAMRIFEHANKVRPLEVVDSKTHLDELTEALSKSDIIGANSRNLVNKLRGLPFQSDVDSATEGIELERLDLLAKAVLGYYNLYEKLGIDKGTQTAWADFQGRIFEIPAYYRHLQDFKYFKFLNDKDKKAVDSFIDRKLSEWDLPINNIHNFCIYVWHSSFKDIRVAILQIDIEKRIANYTFYTPTGDEWLVRTVQSTSLPGGVFNFINNTLYLNLIEEDESKPQLQATLLLNTSEVLFYREKYIKGVICASALNATIPTSWTVVLERMDSFEAAYKVATEATPIKPAIAIEISGHKFEAKETAMFGIEQLGTYRISKVISRVSGAYIFGIIRDSKNKNEKGAFWTKGICYFNADGSSISRVPNSEDIHGKILTDTYYGPDIICMSDIFKDGHDHFKYHYTLHIVDEGVNEKTITKLEGNYCGVHRGLPKGGSIIFIPQRQYSSIDEISKAVDCKHIDFSLKDSYNEDEKLIYDFLSKDKYFITFPNGKESTN